MSKSAPKRRPGTSGNVSHRELAYAVEAVENVAESAVRDMFVLFHSYYDHTNEEQFRSDLKNKQSVIVLRDHEDRLRGFSTAVTTEYLFEGKPVRAFYSGDTVVDHRYWGQQTLWAAWLRLTGSIKQTVPDTPLYWFLVVNGHRSYRCLRAFFDVFYPAHDREQPPREKRLMNLFARTRFGDAYDAERGVISFATSHERLNSAWAEIPEKDRRKPDVRFFLERNAGYTNGDMLVCLTEFASENLKPFARRLFHEGMAEQTAQASRGP